MFEKEKIQIIRLKRDTIYISINFKLYFNIYCYFIAFQGDDLPNNLDELSNIIAKKVLFDLFFKVYHLTAVKCKLLIRLSLYLTFLLLPLSLRLQLLT
jgi:hypothetical protein